MRRCLIMNKLFGALKVNENDNMPTIISKGIVKGLGIAVVSLGGVASIFGIVGKVINRNDEVEVFEKEMEAE
jgi:hypothetical protein